MATSAKRYGLDVKNDLELELRLRRIEAEIERRALAADFGDVSDATQRVTTIPQVTGLRVVGKTPSAVTVAWNQVRISDLRRYELWIAEDLAFSTNLQKFNVASTEFQYNTVAEEGGGGLTTIYVKVRARNRAGNVGTFSVTLNAETGQAQTEDIADESITTEKASPDSAAALDPSDGDPLQGLRVNSAQTAFEYIDLVALSNIAVSTSGGGAAVNKQGTIKFPGGLKIQWDTVNVLANQSPEFDLPEPYTEDHYTVIANFGESIPIGTTEGTVTSWIPSGATRLSRVRIQMIRNSNTQATYVSIGKDTD